MTETQVLIWASGARQANELFRSLMRQARYPWAWRKLQRARLEALRTGTVTVEYDHLIHEQFVTNADVFYDSEYAPLQCPLCHGKRTLSLMAEPCRACRGKVAV